MKPTAYFVWNRNGQNTLSFYKPTDLQTEVTELYSADTVREALMEVAEAVQENYLGTGSPIAIEAIVDGVLQQV